MKKRRKWFYWTTTTDYRYKYISFIAADGKEHHITFRHTRRKGFENVWFDVKPVERIVDAYPLTGNPSGMHMVFTADGKTHDISYCYTWRKGIKNVWFDGHPVEKVTFAYPPLAGVIRAFMRNIYVDIIGRHIY